MLIRSYSPSPAWFKRLGSPLFNCIIDQILPPLLKLDGQNFRSQNSTAPFYKPVQFSDFQVKISRAADLQVPTRITYFFEMAMDSATRLVLCGKSIVENESALSLKNNNSLKLPDSRPLSLHLHSEIETPLPCNCEFQIKDYMDALSTSCFGRFLIYSPRLDSTHDVVSFNFGELPIGTACVADVQMKGRGRSKNMWESPKGCLLFSFTLEMEDGRVVPLLQYVVSLAVREALMDLCGQKGIQHLDVKIKWPNDLYLDGLKVGGILCTSTYKSKKFNVSAGIGLNINNEKPTICLNAVLRKLAPLACELRREIVMAAFFNKFECLYEVFMQQGFQSLEELYYKSWLHSGQRVIVQERIDNEDDIVESVVTIQGLTSSGYLFAVSEDGQTCELHPDGNSFDFFKGLIKRKLA